MRNYLSIKNRDVNTHDDTRLDSQSVGNRQAGPGAKDTGYLHDAANRMTKGRKLTYGYDNNGNQTEKIVPNAATGWSQSWDFENRLIKIEKGTATDKRTVTFTYDPQGRRIEKKVETLANGSTSTETYAYVYDGDNILLEIQTSSSGATEKTVYTHGAGVDEHLALERNGSSYFYHADGLGSIVSITDRNKAVVQSYEYDSYGMVKPSTSFRNSYTYTGREWDKETGLYYYRARYYDPMEGRFIQKDPIGFEGGINVYNYVQGNPLNHTDSLGLSADDVLNWATQQVGSGDYSLWSPNPEVRGGRGSLLGGRFAPKCNIFVADALKAGHCEAGRVDGGRLPTASEWADPNFNIPGCSVVTTPEPGDVVAYHGHVGLYDPITPNLQGTISAAYPTPVVWSNWGFRDGQKPTFRRCKCSQ